MFVLVESFHSTDVDFQPDLGCASILGAAQKTGIEAEYIHGQIKVLEHLFNDDFEVLLSLLTKLDTQQYPDLALRKDADFGQILEEGRKYYRLFYNKKSPQPYFNFRAVKAFFKYFHLLQDGLIAIIKMGLADQLSFFDQYVEEILDYDPDLIGFSLSYGFDDISKIIRRKIKQHSDIPIVVGGSCTPFIDYRNYSQIFQEEFIDYLIVGQGDLAFPRLFQHVNNCEPPRNIPNVYYQTSQGIEGTPPEIVQDLDSLPFPNYSKSNLDGYFSPVRILPLQSSRGCSWGRCAFCSHEAYSQGNYRTMSVARTIELLEHLYQTYHTSFLSFNDAEIPAQRIEKICDEIISSSFLNGRLNIRLYGRLDSDFLKPRLFEKMAEAGIIAINWGMESGNQRILNLMRKGTRVAEAGQILQAAHNAGIYNSVFFIFGFPGETEKERWDSIDFINQHQEVIDLILFGPLSLNKRSPMGQDPDRWGVVLTENENWFMKNGHLDSKKAEEIVNDLGRLFIVGKIAGKKTHVFGYYESARFMIYLFSAFGWVEPEDVKNRFDSDEYLNLFPIIPRTFKPGTDSKEISFYDFSQFFSFDAYLHANRSLSAFEAALIKAADGKRNIAAIIEKTINEFEDKISPEEVRVHAHTFFKDIFDHHWGLAFQYPVRASKPIES